MISYEFTNLLLANPSSYFPIHANVVEGYSTTLNPLPFCSHLHYRIRVSSDLHQLIIGDDHPISARSLPFAVTMDPALRIPGWRPGP
jgi:hypothetical protein